ncbi:MAG: SDR family oxidoreductase, partial [Alphaproteobacteria bacterium]|nr:SDR family oxidoreductase [Alphaproteobacteria bacterium]
RTQGGLEALDDAIRASGRGGATLVPADLSDHDALDELLPAIAARFGRLDGAILAAGALGSLAPVSHIMTQEWKRMWDVNVTANLRLIRALDPLLRATGGGHLIAVSDGALGEVPAYWGGYLATKAALETIVTAYAREVARTGLAVTLVRPPPMATALRQDAFPAETTARLARPDAVAARLLALFAEPPPEGRRLPAALG